MRITFIQSRISSLPARLRMLASFLLAGLPALPVVCGAATQTVSSGVSVSLPADYAVRLHSRAAWETFPLTVSFAHDKYYTPVREQAARQGFMMWTQATKGKITVQVIGPDAPADIAVRFSPANNDGYTTTDFTDGRIEDAKIRIGVLRNDAGDIRCLAAHEFGHALGLDGHSGEDRDIMFPIHRMGHPCRITARDLNTLTVLYPALADPD